MSHKRILLLFSLIILLSPAYTKAQEITQTIRGTVRDGDTRQALPGGKVALYKDTIFLTGVATDENGKYRFENVPVGRYRLICFYLGYETGTIPEINVFSGKEVVMDVNLFESAYQVGEVEITADNKSKGEALNEMAVVSARSFTVEETDRYAGSRGDPARMASNYAGVQGADDSQNGIIVRGNTPYSLLWRLENVNIPNPNHFNSLGRTNGALSMLNNKYLSTSDFYSGAFPAEFGNSIGSAFDLNMKNGNNEKYEFSGQFGLLGTDLFSEGPISRKNGSSYLASYRYATVSIFQALGIDVGTDGNPFYQDGAFKLSFPGKKSFFSVFGLGGNSTLRERQSEKKDTSGISIYQNIPQDEKFFTKMGVIGANYGYTFNAKTYLHLTLAGANHVGGNEISNVYRRTVGAEFELDSIKLNQAYDVRMATASFSFYLVKKFSPKNLLKLGMFNDAYHYYFLDSFRNFKTDGFDRRHDFDGMTAMLQPFVQLRSSLSPRLNLTAGLHGQYYTFNGSKSLEPRAGLRWTIDSKQFLSAGLGWHSQALLPTLYFRQAQQADGSYAMTNRDVDFMRSRHYSLGYTYVYKRDWRLNSEIYYQQLYNLPVEARASSYSAVNEGEDYTDNFPDSLVNTGTGKNYGIEFTLEKYFKQSYMFLLTASLYDAKYTGSNGIEYNSIFNSNYAVNALGLKEFKWGKKKKTTFGIGGKVTVAGGKRFTPLNLAASELAREPVEIDSLRNLQKLPEYFRIDLRINYKINAKKLGHEIGLDLVNLLDRENALRLAYVPGSNPPIRQINQLGRLPIFYYRVDF